MAALDEKFSGHLVRVLKNVKRGNKAVHQAYHVKKAAPGDRYAVTGSSTTQPSSVQSTPVVGPVGDPLLSQPEPETEAPTEPTRMMVTYLTPPWKSDDEGEDPVLAQLRAKFYQSDDDDIQVASDAAGLAGMGLAPTDPVAWGADEPQLLNTLRSGMIRRMRMISGGNGLMVAKIEEDVSGGSFYAYMWMDALRSPLLKQLWDGLIDFSNPGVLSRNAAAAYEIAKACGLDDLIPPTVYRVDRDSSVAAMLPDALIEDCAKLEWVSHQTGRRQDVIRDELSKHLSVQLIRGDLTGLDKEDWFRQMFDGQDKTVVDNFWARLPENRRSAMLRLCAFDFVIGNLDRSITDLAFSEDARHLTVAYGNEVCLPSPKTVGELYAASGAGAYMDGTGSLPLFWSDLFTFLVKGGRDEEVDDFEEIGIKISSRMRDRMPQDLARTLSDLGIAPIHIAGVLSRIWMLETFSRSIAQDPYCAARYYAQLISGGDADVMMGIADFVNETINAVLLSEFDFVQEMGQEMSP